MDKLATFGLFPQRELASNRDLKNGVIITSHCRLMNAFLSKNRFVTEQICLACQFQKN